jgi:type II secretory pathway pseudopilin PulG
MTIVAIVLAVALVLVVVVFAGVVRSMLRQSARERDLLLNQMMNLAGRPWQPPPSEPEVEVEPGPERYVLTPEQLPDPY